jgi:hypothetical protein
VRFELIVAMAAAKRCDQMGDQLALELIPFLQTHEGPLVGEKQAFTSS